MVVLVWKLVISGWPSLENAMINVAVHNIQIGRCKTYTLFLSLDCLVQVLYRVYVLSHVLLFLPGFIFDQFGSE